YILFDITDAFFSDNNTSVGLGLRIEVIGIRGRRALIDSFEWSKIQCVELCLPFPRQLCRHLFVQVRNMQAGLVLYGIRERERNKGYAPRARRYFLPDIRIIGSPAQVRHHMKPKHIMIWNMVFI